MTRTVKGPDGKRRCFWCMATPDYVAYHDEEWGFPVGDDQQLFEKLCLEGFQSGLSWRTILAKRENFRSGFHGFDIARVARYGARDVARLLADAGIVRHRGKIEAVINNARRAKELVRDEGSLAAWFWRFERVTGTDGKALDAAAASVALSKELKKRGWKFVGPTTVHSFLQAAGVVNEHAADCAIHPRVERARRAFRRPAR